MPPFERHEWDVPVRHAMEIQRDVRERVTSHGIRLDQVHTVAGIDAAYKDVARAAVVVLSVPELRVLESATAELPAAFPYVPGLLSFREAPSVIAALDRLTVRPDVLMFDGQGIAHPRRAGLATHLGVYLDMPAVGCAKSRLTGSYEAPGPNPGDRSPLMDHGELIGMVVRTKPRTNPLFVSVGNQIDLETAVALVLACVRGYRLPEPTRLAHNLASLHRAP